MMTDLNTILGDLMRSLAAAIDEAELTVHSDGRVQWSESLPRSYVLYSKMHLIIYRIHEEYCDVERDRDGVALIDLKLAEVDGDLQAFEEVAKTDALTAILDNAFVEEVHRLLVALRGFNGAEHLDMWFELAKKLNSDDGDRRLLSLVQCADSRDFLEFLWRAMILRAADGSKVGAALKDKFREKLDVLDPDLRKLFGNERFPEPWADDSFWWRTPMKPTGR